MLAGVDAALERGRALLDQFGQEVSGSSDSVATWNECVLALLSMRGDPMGPLDKVTSADPGFVMGSVFTGAYRVLGAGVPTGTGISSDLRTAKERRRDSTRQEQAHVDAFEQLVAGEFALAARLWDRIVVRYPRDVVAARIAHDIYLHIGNIEDRVRSAKVALDAWSPGEAAHGWLSGSYSFALEEAGLYAQAEAMGRAALDAHPADAWALHSLAHVYEHLDAQDDAMELLRGNQSWWEGSDLLATHIWWHLALRLIETRDFDEVLAIADGPLAAVSTAFGLSDITSLLWRVELEGVDVADRWEPVIQRWGQSNNLHASAFIDMHAAMAFSHAPSSPDASRFWAGSITPHYGQSANGQFMQSTVLDLINAISDFAAGNGPSCESAFAAIDSSLQSVGGSIAQREILTRTRVRNLTLTSPSAAGDYLNALLEQSPSRQWMVRELEQLSTPDSRQHDRSTETP